MDTMFADSHRALQDRYDTRRLADRVEEIFIHDAFNEQDIAFIQSRDTFFLSTIDPDGRPTVSHKGGAPGFVRVEGNTLVFPCYDGNGMWYSMGNIAATAQVGLLFMDFEQPIRLRVQGEAVIDDGPAKEAWPGAIFLVRVTPTHIFPNCGRYIHRRSSLGLSRHVPHADGTQPLAEWKRIDFMHDSLAERDKAPAQKAGAITVDEWLEKGEA